MAKTFPSNDKDLTNAYLYIELQKKGLNHKEILAQVIDFNGAYSKSIADHVAAIKADQDEFIKNKYSNKLEQHDVNELQKDLGPIPALKKAGNFFHSIVEMLDDGSFEIDLFKTEEDYEAGHPTEIINLTPMLEVDVAASLNEDQQISASLKDSLQSQFPYMSLAKIIFAQSELELDADESSEYLDFVVHAFGEMYDEVDMMESSKKGEEEKKLQNIKISDLEELSKNYGTGITKHMIRSSELSGLSQGVVDSIEKALVAAGNRSFRKWVDKRGSEEGVKWGKAAESHAEFANYATSKHIAETADDLIEKLIDMDLDGNYSPTGDKAKDSEIENKINQQAYKIALDTFSDDIVRFIQKSGPAKYQESVDKFYKDLWGEENLSTDNNEFDVDDSYEMKEAV